MKLGIVLTHGYIWFYECYNMHSLVFFIYILNAILLYLTFKHETSCIKRGFYGSLNCSNPIQKGGAPQETAARQGEQQFQAADQTHLATQLMFEIAAEWSRALAVPLPLREFIPALSTSRLPFLELQSLKGPAMTLSGASNSSKLESKLFGWFHKLKRVECEANKCHLFMEIFTPYL